jgi:3-oxoacyl-[acyl-carrier protein] reductase
MGARVALVTGASRGIGRAIAEALGGAGCSLFLVAHSAGRLETARRELAAGGSAILAHAADLREADAAERVRGACLAEFGRLDVLVNCAGAARVADFLALSDADWADGFALKFHGTRRMCRACWGDLVASGGSIVNIVGSAGRTPGPDYALGGSVNAALLGLTKSLAQRGIHEGVQVNAINPGPVRTDRLAANLAAIAAERGCSVEEAARRLVEGSGITRIGEAHEIAALVAFVVSPAGRLLQGSLIDIDGGQTKSI